MFPNLIASGSAKANSHVTDWEMIAQSIKYLPISRKTALLIHKGTYISADELERADARLLGYETVGQHPNDVGMLGSDELLVLDINFILFADTSKAAQVVESALANGVLVGLHGYSVKPEWKPLLNHPLVVIASTHARLLQKLNHVVAMGTVPVTDDESAVSEEGVSHDESTTEAVDGAVATGS